MKSFIATAILAFTTSVSAHMAMTYPPPLRSKENPFAGSDIDYSITSPLSASGSDFPCKGTLNLLGTKAASSVATWSAGSTHNMTIAGGANHGGGSCQASLSYDNGKTFTVIHSYIGNCPTAGTSSYDFTVPSDAKAGEALFAWTWFNKIGNREMYMNCAVITIDSGASTQSTASTAFSTRPEILVANVGNGCATKEGGDTKFPSPGPDVSDDSTDTIPPVGSCGSSSSGSSASSPVVASSAAASSAVATASYAASSAVSSAAPATVTSASSTSSALLGGVFLTKSEAAVSQTSTTLATFTRPATISSIVPDNNTSAAASATESSAAAASSSSSSPAATTTPTTTSSAASASGTSSSSVGLQSVGSACSDEGAWNCVAGTAFQRCASGEWSAAIPMASGTTCQVGVRADLVMLRARALRV